jgi:hypothetical protein
MKALTVFCICIYFTELFYTLQIGKSNLFDLNHKSFLYERIILLSFLKRIDVTSVNFIFENSEKYLKVFKSCEYCWTPLIILVAHTLL